MTQDSWQKWFEDIWADREDRIYRDFFGDTGPGIYNIPLETFQSLGQTDPDPRYLTHGVFECPPSPPRPHWLYVTSAMSNPWGDHPDSINPDHYSGLGFEFTLHTRHQARWPIQLLHHLMAVQLLIAAGHRQGHLLEYHHRIPLGAPLCTKEGQITHLLVAPPPPPPLGYPPTFQLASGKVDLMLLIGITSREMDFAKTQGEESLLALLHHHDAFLLTNPLRSSLL